MTDVADRDGGRRILGAAGEAAAAEYLQRRGFLIVEMNVRSRLGEIDIVAQDGAVIVFVEVKGNRGGVFGAPEEMVTPAKQRRLARLASWYLQRRGWLGWTARFDVIAVDWDAAGVKSLRHYPDAFGASGVW